MKPGTPAPSSMGHEAVSVRGRRLCSRGPVNNPDPLPVLILHGRAVVIAFHAVTTAVMSNRNAKSNTYCEVCDTSFNRREHYQRHLRTHANERPFACSECGQSFGRVYVSGDFLRLSCFLASE